MTICTANCCRIIIFFSVLLLQCRAFAQPSAAFSATPTSGCSPIVVHFTDQSTGNPSQWKWDLGNGVVSFLQNPSTTYFNAGTYNIKLVVRNSSGADSITKNQFITVYPNPIVDFVASDSSGCFPLPVQFTDLSTTSSGSITNHSWDFGDGDTSILTDPLHTYVAAGNFSVTLRVTNSYGCTQTVSKTHYIKINGGVVASFSNNLPAQCAAPVTVNFLNASTGPASLSYTWNFGDGTTTDSTNPTHTYVNPGSYSVSLVVTSSEGCRDTIQKANLITIGNITAQFTAPDSICQNQTFNIINATTPPPAGSLWDFGDGTNSSEMNPTKKYSTPGTFTIKLINQFSGCVDSISRSILVKPIPAADFVANDTQSCKIPFTAQFTNNTAGNNTYSWNFGDGSTSTDINPTHTYIDTGSYTITLITTNENGCQDTIIKPGYIQIRKPKIILNNLPQKGCVPLTVSFSSTDSANEPVATYLWNFGDGTTSNAATPSHTYTAAGTYAVSLITTTVSGCTDTITMNDAVIVGTKPHSSFSVNPTDVCAFQPIQFTDNSSGNADQWLWDFGDGVTSTFQNPSHLYQDTGFFSVSLIVWNNGCPDTVKINNVVHIRPPIAKFTVNRTCSDKFRADFLDLSIGATGWSWDFGDGITSTQQNPSHIYTTTGVFNVTLTVTNGVCTHTTANTVQIIQVRSGLTADNATACNGTPINFTSTIPDASLVAGWKWNFGDGDSSATPLSASHTYANPGKYTVSLAITDILGCTDTSNLPVTVFGPKAEFSPSVPSICLKNNSPILFTDSSTSDGTHSIVKWIWNYGDGTVDSLSQSLFSHLYTAAGSYDVSLTVADNYGCRNSITKQSTVVISNPIAGFYSPDTLTCTDKPVNFISTSTGNDLQYQWTFGDSTQSVVANPVHQYIKTGNYVINLFITDKYGCKDSVTKSTYINISTPKALFSVSDSLTSCPPLLVRFTNSSSDYESLKWNFGDGNISVLDSPSHYYTLPGVYFATLTVTGPGGCMDSVNKKIDVRGPKGSFSYAPLKGCDPFTVKFNATTLDRISFTWDFSDGTTIATNDSLVSHTYTAAGSYVPKMILQDASGCEVPIVGPDTITVVDVHAKFALDHSLICDSGVVNLHDSSISNDLITGWQWNFGDGNSSNAQDPSYGYHSPGTYDIKLVVTTEAGCKDSLLLNDSVNVFKAPVVNIIGDTSACVLANLDVNGEVISGNPSLLHWQWNLGNGNNFQSSDPPPQTYPNAGPYLITSIVTDEHGCKDSTSKTVNINPLPNTEAKPDSLICVGSSIQLNATGADSYLWNTSQTLNCTNCNDPMASPADNTTYIVTGTNQFGCSSKDSVLIRVQHHLPLQISPNDSICLGQSVQLNASGSQLYSWAPSNGLNNSTIASPRASPTTSTLYTVTARDSANCFSDTASVFVTVFPIPTVDAGPDDTIEVGSNVQLHATGSSDVISWKWTPGFGLSCIDCPNPTAAPRETTEYTIEVRNAGQCPANDRLTIYVVCNKGNLFIPNTFSPNGDGMNDRFYPRGQGVFLIKSFRVFDRWGELVFEKLNFNPNDASAGWDGTFRGKLLSPDVYVYTCEIVCENNQTLTYKGDVTLLR